MSRFLVGIDLGTTNSALAYLDRQARGAARTQLTTFAVPQLVAPGEVGSRPLLPSFLYIPGAHDLPPGSIATPWNPRAVDAVGAFARNQGSKVPGRLVASAKSWLCHPGVDRTAPLLPWGAPPDAIQVSPLEASAKYLKHLVDGWNHVWGTSDEVRLEKQAVVLTVPASFDDSARTLTAEAARLAGLTNVSLLEEPQAAFYAWLATHSPAEAAKLKPGMRVLVLDVGGGTSDFSLIRVGESQGDLVFEREAVGDHLLLGGDNMDLALARFAEAKVGPNRLDAQQFALLVQACRTAKEALWGDSPPAEYPVTVAGRGRSVVAGSVTVNLTAHDLNTVVLDGFFPATGRDEMPGRGGRAGLQEMGLPYVADPAIPKHLAQFLAQHLPPGGTVDGVLFNGGVFTPQALRDRILAILSGWFTTAGASWSPQVLTTPSLDLAVAWGAAYLAHLKLTGGRRIGGGVPRGYYLGVESDEPTPAESVRAVCVVPRHMQEGDEVTIPAPVFELTLGQPVLFPLFSSTVREDAAGAMVLAPRSSLLALPPLHTVLRGGKRAGVKQVPVTLAARATEIGTLELFCVSSEGNRWKLEFNTRDTGGGLTAPGATPAGEPAVRDVYPEERLQAAAAQVRGCYAGQAPAPPELPKALEVALEATRSEWPLGLCRRLWDDLAEVAPSRARSPQHLSRWYNLAGFCLRPGNGDPLDRYRVEALWKLVAAPQVTPGKPPGLGEGGADYWIVWRRVAAGLNAPIQQQLGGRLKPALLSKGKAPPDRNELAEMWRCAASLERLDARTRTQFGEELVRQLADAFRQNRPAPNSALWSLTRLGARQSLYGPLNSLVHVDVVERWLATLAEMPPAAESERANWAFCLASLGKRTGLRGVDVGEATREKVAGLLEALPVSAEWPAMVREVTDRAGEEQSRLFGEALPVGLRMRGE